MEQIAINWGPEPHYFSVSELTPAMRGLLTEHFTDIWVAGEISGVKLPASGHYYFTLKDEAAQLRCVCYKMTARYLKFKPQDGVAVLARGRIDLYDARGEVQLVVEAIEPQGHGALQLAFEQLKKKLAAEGLFDAGAQATAARVAGAHRDRHFAHRRGDPRHAANPGTALSGPPHSSLSGAGAGRGRGGTGDRGHRIFQRVGLGRGGDRGARRRLARRSVDLQ